MQTDRDTARAPMGGPLFADPVARALLDERRDQAERLLNRVRIAVLLFLGVAAIVYAPSLSPALDRANAAVLLPTLAWALIQEWWLGRRERLPGWIAVVNPVVDTTAVSAIIVMYGVASSAALALKSPVALTYFLVLAGRPIASSVRKTVAVALAVALQYAAIVLFFIVSGRATLVTPLAAAVGNGIAPLDEGAKLLFFALGGALAVYATDWHERLVHGYLLETRERARAQDQLAEAQLHSLRLQLQPHFLFNTLNTITALIGSEPRAAERMVSGLSELLRASLRLADEQEVPLARELDHLKLYVDIQQTRFGDRLDVDLDVDPSVRSALVPSLLLQPLVENAIRHGISPRAAGGHIRVRASRDADELQLEVKDDGVGASTRDGAVQREGVGLTNTRERLRRLHGGRHRFAYESRPGSGFAVRIALPFRTDGGTG
ncbi:MAG TPA: histidine kinase [Gemmatimonadaceae bacterium]|nr:histidine kinase [Gemmatimonadaceae bacterium]